MKRLGLLLLCTACAATEAPPPAATAAAAVDAAEVVCPQERTEATGDAVTVLGKHVDKVCVVGDPGPLRAIVAGLAGQPLEAALVGQMLQELFATGLVRDAEAVATPLDTERVMVTWFITPYGRIAKVRVVGAVAVGDDVFASLTPDRFTYASASTLRSLGEVVRDIYEERGYPRAQITVAMAQDDAVVTVSEGTRDDIKRIRFVGLKRVKEAQLREVLLSQAGTVFVADVPARDVMQIESFYRDRGMVQVSAKSSYQDGELLFTISEGDVFKLGALKLSGVALSDQKAVLASLGAKRGAVFSRAVLVRDIEHLRQHAGEQGVPVNVTPLTAIDVKKKTVDVTFELTPAS